jgi:hypothetical protein
VCKHRPEFCLHGPTLRVGNSMRQVWLSLLLMRTWKLREVTHGRARLSKSSMILLIVVTDNCVFM